MFECPESSLFTIVKGKEGSERDVASSWAFVGTSCEHGRAGEFDEASLCVGEKTDVGSAWSSVAS